MLILNFLVALTDSHLFVIASLYQVEKPQNCLISIQLIDLWDSKLGSLNYPENKIFFSSLCFQLINPTGRRVLGANGLLNGLSVCLSVLTGWWQRRPLFLQKKLRLFFNFVFRLVLCSCKFSTCCAYVHRSRIFETFSDFQQHLRRPWYTLIKSKRCFPTNAFWYIFFSSVE